MAGGPYILSLDSGTTSCRAILFDTSGRPVATGQREFTQYFPKPGWVEHDPEEIWAAQAGVIGEAMARAGAGQGDVAAIGITNQRETCVVWDRRTGEPVCNAIVWQDRRTSGMCRTLREAGHEALITERTGLLLDAYFSGTKVAWILDNADGARGRAERGELAFGTIDTWLLWKLTGGRTHMTDASNASRTLLYDIRRGEWDDELLGLIGVPRSVLPEVCDSSGVCAHVDGSGVPAGAPIAGIAGDQQSAMMGQLCTEPGESKNTYGTGCFLLMNTGRTPSASTNRLLSTVAWSLDGSRAYALEGSVFVAGAIVQWLRDGLGIIRHASEIEGLATSVPDSGGVVLVPALAGLGAPHWDPRARGLIAGISRGTTGGHIARAALEGIAFQVVDLVEAMRGDAGGQMSVLRVDGGASANDLLMQMQADLLQAPIERPEVLETTALGAAYLAGLAVGVWESVDQLRSMRTVERRFEPAISADEAQGRLARWRQGVDRAKGWADDG